MTTKITSKVVGNGQVGTTQLADSAVTTPKLADAGVTTPKYAPGSVDATALGTSAVTTPKLADASVTNVKQASGSVDSRVLANGAVADVNVSAVSGAKLLDSSVLGPKIGPSQIGTSHFAAGAVDPIALADQAVITAKVADHAITYVKMQAGTANALLCNDASGNLATISPGTEGNVLAVLNGIPTWTSTIIPTGAIIDFFGNGAPSGWCALDGGTIGNIGSSATTLSSAGSQQLFEHLWNNFADNICPVIGGRGVSSSADFASNKTITLPDGRGRMTAGVDGGSAPAARITSAKLPDGTTGSTSTVGCVGGAESVTLALANIPPHKHFICSPSGGAWTGATASSSNNLRINGQGQQTFITISSFFEEPSQILSGTTGGTGGSTDPFKSISPFLLVCKIIKL